MVPGRNRMAAVRWAWELRKGPMVYLVHGRIKGIFLPPLRPISPEPHLLYDGATSTGLAYSLDRA